MGSVVGPASGCVGVRVVEAAELAGQGTGSQT
jgi:hypothetical protein